LNRAAVAVVSAADLGQSGEGAVEWTSLRDSFLQGVHALEPLQPLLDHVAHATELFSSASKIAVSRIFPVAWALYEHASKLATDNSIATREFATCFRDDIDARFFFTASPKLIQCAEALDPATVFHDRLGHGHSLGSEGDLRQLRDAIAEEMFPSQVPPPTACNAVDYFGETRTTDSESAYRTKFKAEFGLYLKEVSDSPRVEDGLEWWREHWASYPVVAFVARSILSAQASSAETERLFSTAAHVVNKWRNKLTGKRAGQLITLSRALREAKPDKDEESADSLLAEIVDDFE
jgi:hypothetical protein